MGLHFKAFLVCCTFLTQSAIISHDNGRSFSANFFSNNFIFVLYTEYTDESKKCVVFFLIHFTLQVFVIDDVDDEIENFCALANAKKDHFRF